MRPVTQVWPPDDYKGPIHFDVVFFHGFQFGQDAHNMWKTTWSTPNRPETCWPQEWLGPQLGNDVRILLLSYDAYAAKSKSHEFGYTEDVSHIAKNLVQSVVTSSKWKLGQEHPFVLVGHSFGGIVIESLVIEIHKISQQQQCDNLEKTGVEKANAFLNNMAGVAFYAVPHVGSRQLIEYTCRQCEIDLHSKQLAKVKAIILENIDSSKSKAADLSNDFFNTLASCTKIYGVYVFIETKPIDDNGMIVEYGAAQIPGHKCYRVEGCDHFSVCKPPDQNHPSYNMLLQFLEGCCKVNSNIQAIWLPENLELPQQVGASKFHKMRKLRMLIMEGANETFIQSCFGQHFSQLKWLNISSNMTQLPESMRHLVGLTILQLPNCQNLLLIPEFLINMT
ncbi:unnamed protein product, partial [Sphagnum balticum]